MAHHHDDNDKAMGVLACPKCARPYSMKIGQRLAKYCPYCDYLKLRGNLLNHDWKSGNFVEMNNRIASAKDFVPACPSCGCAYSTPSGQELLYWCVDCDVDELSILLLSHPQKQPLQVNWHDNNAGSSCSKCGHTYSVQIGQELVNWCSVCDAQELAVTLLSHGRNQKNQKRMDHHDNSVQNTGACSKCRSFLLFANWTSPVKWCTICDTQKLAAMLLSRPACQKCGQLFSAKMGPLFVEWCFACDIQELEARFTEWTSDNEAIDNFIQKTQSNASNYMTYIEWIDPQELSDIKHLADGGFGSVYTATFSKGMRSYKSNSEIGLYQKDRAGFIKVALKTLHGSKNITADFFNEV